MILSEPVAVTGVAGLALAALPGTGGAAETDAFADVFRDAAATVPEGVRAGRPLGRAAGVFMPQVAAVAAGPDGEDAGLSHVIAIELPDFCVPQADYRTEDAATEPPEPGPGNAMPYPADRTLEREQPRSPDSVPVPDTGQSVSTFPADASVPPTVPAMALSATAVPKVAHGTAADPPQNTHAGLLNVPSISGVSLATARTPQPIETAAQSDARSGMQRLVRSVLKNAPAPLSDEVRTAPTPTETLPPVLTTDAARMAMPDPIFGSSLGPAPTAPAGDRSVPDRPAGLDVAVPAQTLQVPPESARPATAAAVARARTERPETTSPARAPFHHATSHGPIPPPLLRERDVPAVPIHDLPGVVKGSSRAVDPVDRPWQIPSEAGLTGAVAPGSIHRPDNPGIPPALGGTAQLVPATKPADPPRTTAAESAPPVRPSPVLPTGDPPPGRMGETRTMIASGRGPDAAALGGSRAGPDQPLFQMPTAAPATVSEPAMAQPEPWNRDLPGPGTVAAAMQIPFPDRTTDGHANSAVPDGSRPVPLPMPVSVQIADAAAGMRDGRIELTLSPEELGQVRLHLTTTDTSAIVAVSADRIDTLDLIRRHLDDLTRDFRALGYQDVSFQFSHGDPGPQGRADPGNAQAHAEAPEPPAPPRPAATYQTAPSPPQHGDAGLDLRL